MGARPYSGLGWWDPVTITGSGTLAFWSAGMHGVPSTVQPSGRAGAQAPVPPHVCRAKNAPLLDAWAVGWVPRRSARSVAEQWPPEGLVRLAVRLGMAWEQSERVVGKGPQGNGSAGLAKGRACPAQFKVAAVTAQRHSSRLAASRIDCRQRYVGLPDARAFRTLVCAELGAVWGVT